MEAEYGVIRNELGDIKVSTQCSGAESRDISCVLTNHWMLIRLTLNFQIV